MEINWISLNFVYNLSEMVISTPNQELFLFFEHRSDKHALCCAQIKFWLQIWISRGNGAMVSGFVETHLL